MINLTLPCTVDDPAAPGFVTRLGRIAATGEREAALVGEGGGRRFYQCGERTFELPEDSADDYVGDVVFIEPGAARAQRWIRSKSRHNTLLVTEQCDQLCRMCSQPPKKTHDDQYERFLEACILAPEGLVIGVSGGEPTLHKNRLFSFLIRMRQERPDIGFHVLTNAQHFEKGDLGDLERLDNVLWGAPVYAGEAGLHDDIVGKQGAFARLQESFAVLARAGAAVELRTVLMRANAPAFAALADYVVDRLGFVDVWAVMQLERAGFAKNQWAELFFDHSGSFEAIGEGLATAMLHGVDVALYNFPFCTLPPAWRPFAAQSISDWKNKYLGVCGDCTARGACAGFFEWHPEQETYQNMGPI